MSENEQPEVEPEASEGAETAAEAPAAAAPASPVHRLSLNGGSIPTTLDVPARTKDWMRFSVGDTVKVHYRIKEGDKERIQVYEGVVISARGSGMDRTFVVRRVSHEIGVERIFPYHSPSIQKIEVSRRGKVRRAKLFYLRGKSGKEGRIKEVFDKAAAEAAKARKQNATRPRRGKKKAASKTESQASAG